MRVKIRGCWVQEKEVMQVIIKESLVKVEWHKLMFMEMSRKFVTFFVGVRQRIPLRTRFGVIVSLTYLFVNGVPSALPVLRSIGLTDLVIVLERC